MKKAFFETVHSASSDFPYFDSNMQNIEYLSHFHREIEIVLVKSGKVDIICENKAFSASAGDICIFLPGEIHSFVSSAPNHLYIIKISSGNSVEKIDFSAIRLSHNLFPVGSEVNAVILQHIEQLHTEIREKQIGYAYKANGISNAIIGDILRLGNTVVVEREEQKRHLYAIELLENVNEFIEEHYRETVYLEDVARYCSLSKFYFSHLFKNITGATFHEHITKFRLEKALQLLGGAEKKMVEIALDCGFTGTRAFNREFVKTFKKTPSEYRAALRTEAHSND